ncbi:unnamed protein product [Arabis nemorensis]|uniref:Uncharacterized protein n=1 Tax=Arabis nemorensis TaxID=586526 RepID=A0A565CN19_9BRAS|nr:unnamed protein product [Arabis nemorensis]
MALFLRLLRGNWIIGPCGRWEFQSERSDIGYGANFRGDESYEALLGNVRRRFLLNGTTPLALSYRIPPLMPEPNSTGQLPNAEYHGRRIEGARRALEQIFTKAEMLMHRVHFEILYSNLLNQAGANPMEREPTSPHHDNDRDGDDDMDLPTNRTDGTTDQRNMSLAAIGGKLFNISQLYN